MVNFSENSTACLPQLAVFFAHNEEYQAQATIPQGLSARQLQRWKSRQLAQQLLALFLQQHQFAAELITEIKRTPSGRPFLPIKGLDFNISHSGDWVALIVSYQPSTSSAIAVGIDIESPSKPRAFEKLMRRYANPEEIAQLISDNQTALQLEERFYLSWSLREALLKAQGVGIVKLSEVSHFPTMQQIYTAHCPKGTLHFYHQLPFYLSYFYAAPAQMAPALWQLKQGKLQKIATIKPLVYQVNPSQ